MIAPCPQVSATMARANELESKLIRLRASIGQTQREVAALKAEIAPRAAAEEIANIVANAESGIVPLHLLEKQAILRAVELKSVVVAAKLLGVGKTTLYRKLHEYGFDLSTLKEEEAAA